MDVDDRTKDVRGIVGSILAVLSPSQKKEFLALTKKMSRFDAAQVMLKKIRSDYLKKTGQS